MSWSVVSRTARPNGGRARESRRWLAGHHPSGTRILALSVPPTTRQKKKRKPHSACGSNGAPTRVPLGGPRNGERHVLSLAPTAKRTARLHHSTPPVSMATTTRRQRVDATNSGYVVSLSILAWTNTAPSTSAACGRGSPELPNALRSVISTASWAPPKHGRS